MLKIAKALIGIWVLTAFSQITNAASDEAPQLLPGTDISITPIFSSLPEEHFRGEIAIAGLKELGYNVLPAKQTGYATMLLALAYGDGDFSIHMWDVLHNDFFQKAGGSNKIFKAGNIIPGLKQGYLIDKKTAEKYAINSLNDLADPEKAAIFDTDKDGRADLIGCNPDWGYKDIIEGHLDTYGLKKTVSHNRGDYFALMKATIKRHKSGKPILYYTWQPQWISSVLKPGKDVVWLTVEPPETLEGVVLPTSTTLADTNSKTPSNSEKSAAELGFEEDQIKAVMNLKFATGNPVARTFLSLLQIPAADESAQNLKMMRGEKSPEDIQRHAVRWIKKNRKTFDEWLKQAREAAPAEQAVSPSSEITAAQPEYSESADQSGQQTQTASAAVASQ